MTTKYSPPRLHTLALPESISVDISTRTLPPLPVSKRQLPSLPQSTSGYVHNACTDDKVNTPKTPKTRTSITITPPTPNTLKTRGRPVTFTPPTQKRNSSFADIRSSRGSRTIRNILNKMQTKMASTRMSELIKMNDTTLKALKSKDIDTNIKSKWRPTLKFICDDDELLNNLIVFMGKQYNEENILFLRSVNKLKLHISNLLQFVVEGDINIVEKEKIDVEITSIYNNYITHTAQKQINLSSNCFNNTMNIHLRFKYLSLNEKGLIFDPCCVEIENLIQNSILCGFYQSEAFQFVARSRNIFSNNDHGIKGEKEEISISETDYDSDDVEYENKNDDDDDKDVYFNICSSNKWTKHNKYILSSKGFAPNSGYHEWKIKILKCSPNRQEFGIISNFDTNIEVNEYGICDTPLFGARAVYGYNTLIQLNKNKKRKGTEHNFYYASYNNDNTIRCNKTLSSLNIHQRQWMKGDIIKICLNLTKSSIKFFLNDQQVRKTVSVDKDTTYYPIILYSGDFQFQLIS